MKFIKLSKKFLIFIIIIVIISFFILNNINFFKNINISKIKNQSFQKSFLSSPNKFEKSNLSLSKLKRNNVYKLKNLKSYIISEDNNDSEKFLNDINKEEKEKFESLKKMFLSDLSEFNDINNLIKEYKNKIIEVQQQIDLVPKKIIFTNEQILKFKKIKKEIYKNINIQKKNIQDKKSNLQTQGITIYNNQEIYKMENQIKELIKQKTEINKEILKNLKDITLIKKKLNDINTQTHQNWELYQKLNKIAHQKKQFYINKFLYCLEKLYIN
ncbi:hypothetical protein OC686_02180 ['Opuntia sp.' phytoplasma]|uniref:Effector n=2 Tax=Candidatus Phytoplasma asiaticum TaxID=2763338 RepID=A0AAX3BA31_9MOLU|nr:hypothetical protein ['Opuntia sp.' phytoplasma]MDO8058058.1 hypothetical protein ['Opuntia sp.' phytoplasma]UQV27397.1 hypothetical protein H7686_0001065 ['Parthenium hysterophorus' phyllody phytoplasma]